MKIGLFQNDIPTEVVSTVCLTWYHTQELSIDMVNKELGPGNQLQAGQDNQQKANEPNLRNRDIKCPPTVYISFNKKYE
jgi:hypothetical protein